ncbi:RING/U-box protein [Arabidopsis thaliana]|uniref:U-box domain-containing protein 57 n=2 Tax=Arabidopsis thaliana TaxID=3702 RepID=PUB57_ARATH|nr:RING/U-box protein [Arabidopsis thaliana]Q9SGT1.2 RecName: Full=U-box domain-containing protein 57; AltName: Full=Plant U-box protein 57; AltName: Full=RING-type E3 ubiquitin transferase PUB57 [Arabidopsis thaliana]AEE33333.2 RING/U-box protein [Arabidopsis thaliana]|eukprot:NP_001319249.1 RING/U-box protein [Arabidopsis thaliana]
MVKNSYVLFARLCVELPPLPSDESHGEITTVERQFLRNCQMELENLSLKTELPLVYVDESKYWRFIKTVRVLAEVFNNMKTTRTTRKSIIQVLMNPILPSERSTDAMNLFLSTIEKLADLQFSDEDFNQLFVSSRLDLQLENKYNDKVEVKLRKEAEDALARKIKEVVDLTERLLQVEALEHKHKAKLQLRTETETAVAIERDYMRWKAEIFESEFNNQLVLRRESEIALDKERKELEGIKNLLETCFTGQKNLKSQVITWKDKYDQGSSIRKEKEVALSTKKLELEIFKQLAGSYKQDADAMRQERDNALKTVQEIVDEQQPPPSFICPITQDVMKNPHMAADGFTYELEAIQKWINTGHRTSPMTNLKLSHFSFFPNRALRSAIEELGR